MIRGGTRFLFLSLFFSSLVVAAPHSATTTLLKNCTNAHGSPTGIADPTEIVPSDTGHKNSYDLRPGPISCYCGKAPFVPRPGDDCVAGVIHPAQENFCGQAGGLYSSSKARDNSVKAHQCLCGGKLLEEGHCCTEGKISECAVKFDPSTWPNRVSVPPLRTR